MSNNLVFPLPPGKVLGLGVGSFMILIARSSESSVGFWTLAIVVSHRSPFSHWPMAPSGWVALPLLLRHAQLSEIYFVSPITLGHNQWGKLVSGSSHSSLNPPLCILLNLDPKAQPNEILLSPWRNWLKMFLPYILSMACLPLTHFLHAFHPFPCYSLLEQRKPLFFNFFIFYFFFQRKLLEWDDVMGWERGYWAKLW